MLRGRGLLSKILLTFSTTIFVLALLLFWYLLPAYSDEMTFVPEEILQAPWGSEEGEVGLLKGPDIYSGLASFAVDEDNSLIYILDTINNRVLIYTTDGKLNKIVPISIRGNDISIGDKRNFFVLDAHRGVIDKYNILGNKVATYKVSDSIKAEGIVFKKSKGVFVKTSEQALVPVIEYREKFEELWVKPEVQKRKKTYGLFIGNSESRFLTEFSSKEIAAIKIFNQETKEIKRILIKKEKHDIAWLYPIGSDKNEDIYIVVNELLSDAPIKTERYLKKYDLKGNLLAKAVIPLGRYASVSKTFFVGGSGDVYQLFPYEKGIKIIRWKQALADKLGTKKVEEIFLKSSDENKFFFVHGRIRKNF